MDKVKNYRALIKNLLTAHAHGNDSPHDEYEAQLVFDELNDHYFLMGIGWERYKRVHGCTLHLDLKGEKIWIQQDWTEPGIANELEAAGVPKSDIVLAFHAPYRRKLMEEYAIA